MRTRTAPSPRARTSSEGGTRHVVSGVIALRRERSRTWAGLAAAADGPVGPEIRRPRRRQSSRRPRCGSAGIGNVGAVRAGANGAVEVLTELGVVFSDPRYPLAHGAGH